MCRAYADAGPSRFVAAVVQWDVLPDDPLAFGDEVEAIRRLLQQIDGWRVVNVGEVQAKPLGSIMERDLGRRIRYYGDIHHTFMGPAVEHTHPLVRLLTPADAPLFEAASWAIQGAGLGGPAAVLREGIVAGAVDGDRLLAVPPAP